MVFGLLMASPRVVIKDREMQALLEGPNGPVGKDLIRRCIKVQNKARTLAPVDTGNLRGSITYEVAKKGRNLVGFVGTNVPYAIFVHEGTRHIAPRPFLRDALPACND